MAGTALNYKPNTTTNDGSTANAAIELATPEALAWYAMKASATGGSSLCATMTSSMSLAGTNYTGVAQADVDANVSKALPWKSIAGTFTGTFTSGGNTVDGLYVYHDKGLFGTVGGAGSISGLSIGANSLIESGAESTGAVAASLEGTASITDCVNAAAVRSTTGVAAGIVYDVQGSATIERCGNAGAITAGSTRAAAGIAGWVRDGSSGSIKNCYNTGAITGGGPVEVGGKPCWAAGICFSYNSSVPLASCYNAGTVSDAVKVVPVASKGSGAAASMSNCYYDNNVFTGAAAAEGSTGLPTDQMKAWKTAYKLNGDTYVGSTDGTNPAHTVWTVAADNTVNSGYPVFGDLKTDTAVATIDPDVTTMAGVASAELTSALGTSVSLGASSEVLAAPTWESSDTAATEPTLRSATTEVSDKFSSWGTTNADANVALSLGEWDTTSMGLAGSPVVLTSGLAAGDTLATTDASAAGVALNVAAAYGRADTLTYQVLLASGKKCYSTTITVKPATRRTISADTKVDAELFELSPDGTVKSAEAKRSSKVQNQGAAPVAGSVTSIEPLAKDSVISGDFNGDSIPESVTITDELVPTAEGTTLLDSNESVSRAEGGMVKLGVKAKDAATGADADKKTNIGGLWTGLPTELPLYFVPSSGSTAGTVPLAFSLPGTTDADAPSVLSYLYFMDYTGTYVLPAGATAGSFGYRMAYELSIPAGDVDAATASKTTP